VYLGIHWSFDDLIGREVGADVAQAIVAAHFQPVPEPGTLALIGACLVPAALRRR
jgi:hypothetical protein